MNHTFTITMYGTRGSVPCNGDEFSIYGGATTCVGLQCGGQELFLDGGSGIISAPKSEAKEISILFSHLHLDHILGLPFYQGLFEKDQAITFYGKARSGKTVEQTLSELFRPPYWPIGISELPAHTSYAPWKDSFDIGDIHIDTMEGAHAGGSTIYKINYFGKALVFATDFEHNDIVEPELIRFAANCDLLIYDAQYTDEEYPKFHGFGHSTPSVGIDIAKKANAKRLLFTHHSPHHTDEEIAALEQKLQTKHPFASFAKATQIIQL